MAYARGEGQSAFLEDCHYRRMKCIYLDDLTAAVYECHENFLLVKKNLDSINQQMNSRRCPPNGDKLIRTQKGLVHEYGFRLQEAMKDVLQAVEEHFLAELKNTENIKPSQDRLWTLTEDLMSQSGATGKNLLMNLAALVAEERKVLQALDEGFSLEEDLLKFKEQLGGDIPDAAAFDSLVEGEQNAHVRGFLRTRRYENEAVKLEDEMQALRAECLELLEQTARGCPSVGAEELRDIAEDWEHGVDERLELVAMEAEAKCLEEIRNRYQQEAQVCLANQDSVSQSRDAIEVLRAEVRSNQEAIRQLTRRNADGRKRLEETRAEVRQLSDACIAKLSDLSTSLSSSLDSGQRCISAVASPTSNEALLNSPCARNGSRGSVRPPHVGAENNGARASLGDGHLSADALIGQLARQVVSENEQKSIGHLDYERLLQTMRARSESLGLLLSEDEKECTACVEHKKPLLEMARAAVQNGERNIETLEMVEREKEELPKAMLLANERK